ncbi:hypothetical protein GGX14DRAFT_631648 [Mycena pura]|uniref:RRM domain-containing protein n=1 Tax=Mycena pura TaxID=153505 RepID=A0AAD6VDT7_9AGAR|nr:hypothetical protein GGX14DRAFT_631648 [Mycena pura]
MASLLERMNVPVHGSLGPVRSKTGPSDRRPSPYNRPSKGDIDSPWAHDMFEQHNSLSARMNITPGAPKANLNHAILGKALQAATGSSELSIKGASSASQGNVVEVTGLVGGTTPDDVVAIFKRCGEIVKATALPGKDVTIRVTFKNPSSASAAVQKFHNQPADGKTLSVRIVGTNATSLGGRLGGPDGLGLVREEGSVDVLMDTLSDSGSKMRSDSLLNSDPRAQVLLAPPGANPSDYVQGLASRNGNGAPRRGRGGRSRGGRGGGAKRGGGRGRMDID